MDRKRKPEDIEEAKIDTKRVKYSHDNYKVSIADIPNEVLSIILGYIRKAKYRKELRLVNSRWCKLVTSYYFRICRRTLTKEQGAELIQLFGRYERPIRLSFPVLVAWLPSFWQLTNLVALDIPYTNLTDIRYTRLTNLTYLSINNVKDTETSMEIIRHFTKLKNLRATVLLDNNLRLPNLVSLEYQHIRNLVHTPDILWPSLTHLNAPWLGMISPKQAFNVKHLTVLSEHNRSERTQKCFTGLQTLVSRNIMFDDLPMSLTRLEFTYKTTADQTAMIERLTNLKVLLIDESTSHFNISAMTNLESFRLIRPGDYTQALRNHRFLEQIWPNKLTRLEYIIESRKHMNMISRLTALRHLTLHCVFATLIDHAVLGTLTRLTRIEWP